MSVSLGTMIGQLIPLMLMLVLIIVAIRFVLAATRLMNRKADELEMAQARARSNEAAARTAVTERRDEVYEADHRTD